MVHRSRRRPHPPALRVQHPAGRPVISVSAAIGCSVVQVVGQLSPAGAGRLRVAMHNALTGRPDTVIVDLNQSDVDDPAGVETMLVLMKRHARRFGADFIVTAPPWLLQRRSAAAALTLAPTLRAAWDLCKLRQVPGSRSSVASRTTGPGTRTNSGRRSLPAGREAE